jgi:uncharacterized protein (TIGR03067 family)
MRRRTLILLAAVTTAGAVLAAPVPQRDPTKQDLQRLQGTWRLDARTLEGDGPLPAPVMTYTFVGSTLIICHNGHMLKNGKLAFELDARKKPPAIDIKSDDGGRVRVSRGIYKLDGDTLTICSTRAPSIPRPTDFASPKGSGMVLAVLKRAKK